MRFSLTIAGFLLLPIASLAAHPTPVHLNAKEHEQGPTKAPQAAASAAKTDAAKEADIRKLLDLVGTKALLSQSFDEMTKSLKPFLANSLPPGDYREKLIDLFFAKFTTKENVQQFLDLAVPVYDKNFSHQEIRSLIE